eukprot:jgi/Galph1/4534/GphlegSOOS_G3168.1
MDDSAKVGVGRDTQAFQTQVTIDNEKDFYHTIISVKTMDRPGLLKDLTNCLEGLGLTIESALAQTENQLVHDTFFVTDAGSKVTEEFVEKIEDSILQTLKKYLDKQDNGTHTQKSFTFSPTQRNHYVDHELGVSVSVDNSSSPYHTVIRLKAPSQPGLISQFLESLAYLELNVKYASLETNNEGNIRQDIFHVTSVNGTQLDETMCSEIVNMAYFLFSSPDVEEDSY